MTGVRRAAALLAAGLLASTGCGRNDPAYAVPGGDPAEGRALVHAFGCTACHFIPGENLEPAGMGPPLTRWAERYYIAGNLPNVPENLVLWITEPQGIEPLTAMPDLGVTEREARHIAAYLYTLYEDLPSGPADPFLVRRALRRDSAPAVPAGPETRRP